MKLTSVARAGLRASERASATFHRDAVRPSMVTTRGTVLHLQFDHPTTKS